MTWYQHVQSLFVVFSCFGSLAAVILITFTIQRESAAALREIHALREAFEDEIRRLRMERLAAAELSSTSNHLKSDGLLHRIAAAQARYGD